MKVQVRLFARARDLAGADIVSLELPEGATVANVREELAQRVPTMRELLTRAAIAVDEGFATDATPIPPNAEVALIPPVSGG